MMKTPRWPLLATLIAVVISTAGLTQLIDRSGPGTAQAELQIPATQQHQPLARAYELSDAFRQVSKNTLPAVVSIKTTGRVVRKTVAQRSPMQSDPFLRQFLNDPRFRGFIDEDAEPLEREFRAPSGQGSGFIIESSGVVLTNAHVVDDAEQVIVRLADGREFPATEVLADERADVAVLKIDAGEKLPFLPLGDDEQMEIGDWVLAFGSPFGMHRTVTQGIISAKGRGLGGDGAKEFLQTDAAVNPGNSGGPLVNLRGEVVGINTAISTRSGGYDGVSFAVPVNLVRWVSDQLQANGEVRRAYIGIQMQTIDAQLARSFDLGVPQGVVVTDIVKGSPADKAGFMHGDVIVEVDGRRIQNPLNMLGVVERLSVGQTYKIGVLRDGRETRLSITVAQRPSDLTALRSKISGGFAGGKAAFEVDDLGVSVQDLTQQIAEQLGISTAGGVVITAVKPSGPAAAAGLEPGMIIMNVGTQPISSAADMAKMVQESRKNGQVLLLVKFSDGSSNGVRYVSVTLE